MREQSRLEKEQKNHSVTQNVAQRKPNKTGLPDNLKSGIENLSGHSMDDVKVHYNSSRPAQLHAHAFAQGNQIHLASGQEKHLPHEAWHVVQQKQGRVKPTMQLKSSVAVNDDPVLEKEADVMGVTAMGMENGSVNQLKSYNVSDNGVVQGFFKEALGTVAAIGGTLLLAPAIVPAAAAGVTASLGVGLATGYLGYKAGEGVEHVLKMPKPVSVSGEIVDGIYRTSYNYTVTFSYSSATVHLTIRLIPDMRAMRNIQTYINEVKQKVAQIFNNRMRVEYKGKTFPVTIDLDLMVANPAPGEAEEGVFKGHDYTPVMALSGAGRADARKFMVDDRNRALVGAHEVGHHLGLYDEYPDDQAPHRRVYNDHSIMQTVDRNRTGDPTLKDRHIHQIEREIQHEINQQIIIERAEREGRLPL